MEDLRGLAGSLERAKALYEAVLTGEGGRLQGALWLEKRTTLQVLCQELKPNSRVLDLGCGTGVYALPLARAGHSVLAVDLVPRHIAELEAALEKGMAVEAVCDDAQHALDGLPDAQFDAVLCLGPMYHLRTSAERVKLLNGCRRVLKPDGKLLVSFINNDWVIATMSLGAADANYILDGDYDRETFRCDDFPFVFHTLAQADGELARAGLTVRRRINADGLNELLAERFDAMSPAQREAWFRFHLYLCEQPQHLGACNHWLFVCGADCAAPV